MALTPRRQVGHASTAVQKSTCFKNSRDLVELRAEIDTMDLGRDVLTRTLIGSTESEKVFTPWWVTIHHYLVYTLVILGKIPHISKKILHAKYC